MKHAAGIVRRGAVGALRHTCPSLLSFFSDSLPLSGDSQQVTAAMKIISPSP